MFAAGNLAALMKEWPLNSVMLPTATHSKWREALDWKRHSSGDLRNRQMDGQDEGSRRIYITREISRRGDGNSEDSRKFHWWSIRREEEEFILGRGSRTILPDRWRSPHKGPVLKPASLPNSLYWARWVWVRSHLQWKAPPPQIGTLQLAPFVERTCVLVRTIIGHGGIKPPRSRPLSAWDN